jgi:hypothetical protein
MPTSYPDLFSDGSGHHRVRGGRRIDCGVHFLGKRAQPAKDTP